MRRLLILLSLTCMVAAHAAGPGQDEQAFVATLHLGAAPHVRYLDAAGRPLDYAAFARSVGLKGINVDTAGQLGPAWDTALAADRPVLIDVRCDPNVPPIPPHATFEQAKATASALLHGDEDRWGVVKEGLKQKVQQYLPGEKESD